MSTFFLTCSIPYTGKGKWTVARVPAAEDLLLARPLSPSALAGVLEAVAAHVEAAGADTYTVQCAEGILFSALAPYVSQVLSLQSPSKARVQNGVEVYMVLVPEPSVFLTAKSTLN